MTNNELEMLKMGTNNFITIVEFLLSKEEDPLRLDTLVFIVRTMWRIRKSIEEMKNG